MRTALTAFEDEITKLEEFLSATDAEGELLTAIDRLPDGVRTGLDASVQIIRSHRTIGRRQVYFSSIIVMYGALERFVEEAVAEYTEELVEIWQKVENLPEKLRDRHTHLTIEYLFLLSTGRIRGTDEIASVVKTLQDSLSGTGSFRLNARAFFLQGSNMNMRRIHDIMRRLEIAIPSKRLLSTGSYSSHLCKESGRTVSDMKATEVKSELDHIDFLVGLRNDIAHGLGNVVNIEDNSIVRTRCTGLRAFAKSLNEILLCELLRARIARNELVRVESDVRVFGREIVCFSWPSGRLVRGDCLVMQPADQGADLRHGRILSIEVEGDDQAKVEGRAGLTVGVRVAFRVKANGIYYVWQQSSARRGR